MTTAFRDGQSCGGFPSFQLNCVSPEYTTTGLFAAKKNKLLRKCSKKHLSPFPIFSFMISCTYFPFRNWGLLYLIPPVLWHKLEFAWSRLHKVSIACKLKSGCVFPSVKKRQLVTGKKYLIYYFFLFSISCFLCNLIFYVFLKKLIADLQCFRCITVIQLYIHTYTDSCPL